MILCGHQVVCKKRLQVSYQNFNRPLANPTHRPFEDYVLLARRHFSYDESYKVILGK